ncbi:hypothetical protein HYY73_06465 [Candidatus Woesearchaeota archaeon]|nr:hypothetical protein [Candidatus Woesearchaeota archaeon]
MEQHRLEQAVELEYMHFNPNRPQFPDTIDSHIAGESIAKLGEARIVYFWRIDSYGTLQSVVVPGIVTKERYRRDGNGNEYSLVNPVGEPLRPGFERLVWFNLVTLSGLFLPENIKFDYWSSSDATQRPQQRE